MVKTNNKTLVLRPSPAWLKQKLTVSPTDYAHSKSWDFSLCHVYGHTYDLDLINHAENSLLESETFLPHDRMLRLFVTQSLKLWDFFGPWLPCWKTFIFSGKLLTLAYFNSCLGDQWRLPNQKNICMEYTTHFVVGPTYVKSNVNLQNTF